MKVELEADIMSIRQFSDVDNEVSVECLEVNDDTSSVGDNLKVKDNHNIDGYIDNVDSD